MVDSLDTLDGLELSGPPRVIHLEELQRNFVSAGTLGPPNLAKLALPHPRNETVSRNGTTIRQKGLGFGIHVASSALSKRRIAASLEIAAAVSRKK